MRLFISVVFSVLLVSPVLGFIDTFDDGHIDSAWSETHLGFGPSVAEVNGQLEIAFPPESEDGVYGIFSAGLKTQCVISGDFDAQVDFHLLDWQAQNGVRMGLGIISDGTSPFCVIERISFGVAEVRPDNPPEAYGFHVGGLLYKTEGTEIEGKFRLIRNGNIAIGYVWKNSTWEYIQEFPVTQEDVSLELAAWSHDYAFGDQVVRVAFDNFKINFGEGCWDVVPNEPTSFGSVKSLYR